MDALAVNPLSPESLILAFGLAGVFVILYAETGLLIGFFLPERIVTRLRDSCAA